MNTQEKTERQHWISVLARADFAALEERWNALGLAPDYCFIRAPEIGLAQVRARMGASGRAFNMGDVTLTRAVVKLDSGELGYSYIRGRNKLHAERAALIDALLQRAEYSQRLMTRLITPLVAQSEAQSQQRSRQVACSKVDFFTLVRGEDD